MQNCSIRKYFKDWLPSPRDSLFRAIVLGTLLNWAFIFGASIGTERVEQESDTGGQTEWDNSKPKQSLKEWMFEHPSDVSTIMIAFFNGLLVYVTYRLVISTNNLWEAGERQITVAKISAEAANLAANVAKSALIDTERAFIFCAKQTLSMPDEPYTPDSRCIIQIEWSNKGKTWTKHGLQYVSWRGPEAPIDLTYDFPNLGDNPTPGRIFIGPGGTAFGGPILIPPFNIIEALERRRHLYVWGWIEYDDIFSNTPRHRTEFCFEVIPILRPSELPDGQRSVVATFQYFQSHNGAHDDCIKPIETGSPKNPLRHR